MSEYSYTRAKLSSGDYEGIWDINNPDRGTCICQEIEADGSIAKTLDCPAIICSGTSAKIYFNDTLSGAEETALDALVLAHKNNT